MRLPPLYRFGIPALALGQGLAEAGFVLAVRAGLTGSGAIGGDSPVLFAVILACVLIRFLFQDRGAALEARALRDTVSALRGRLLGALRTRAVPAYRPGPRRALERALEEHVPRAAEGMLARRHFEGALLQCGLFVPFLVLLSWKTALLGLAFGALLWPVLRWRNRALKTLEAAGVAGRGAARRARDDFAAALESLPGSGWEGALRGLDAELAEAHRPEWKWRRAQARYPAVLETGLFFVLAAVLIAGAVTLPGWDALLLFSLLLVLAYRPVREAARHYPISLAGEAALRGVEGLARDWESRPLRRRPDAHPEGYFLALRGVDFGYEPGHAVFTDFTATFPADQVTGITGPNGAGKTTALRLLAGAEIPGRGAVLWPEAARAGGENGGVAYLPQRAHPGSDWPAWAAALKARRPDLWGDLNALLRLDRLAHASTHPEALSGGERQRMSLARALASGAAFLLLDEPTTALPADERERVLAGALEIWTRGGRGAVVVSHEPFLDRICGAVTRIDAAGHPAPVPASAA